MTDFLFRINFMYEQTKPIPNHDKIMIYFLFRINFMYEQTKPSQYQIMTKVDHDFVMIWYLLGFVCSNIK